MSAPVIVNGSFARRLWPGLDHMYGDEYARRLNEYEAVFETRKSNKLYELALTYSSMQLAPVKGEGEATAYDSFKQLFTAKYTNVVYSKGFVISHELQEDDQYPEGIMSLGASELNLRMKQTKEIIGQNILNNAFSTAAQNLGPDGRALIAANHRLGNGSSTSNKPSVDADFSEAAIEQACIDIRGFVDESGIIIGLEPQLVVIHRNDEFNAARLFLNSDRPGTADRDINAVVKTGKIPGGAKVFSYLTDSDAWYVKTSCPKSLIHYTREGYKSMMEDDFDTSNSKYKVEERYCFGWSNYRGIYGSQGA